MSSSTDGDRGPERNLLRAARLRGVPAFRPLSATELDHLASWLTWHRIRKNAVFSPTVLTSDDLLVVIEGELGLIFTDGKVGTKSLSCLRSGEFFCGFVAVAVNDQSIRAIGEKDGVAVRIPRQHLHKILQLYPDVVLGIYSTLCGTLNTLTALLGDMYRASDSQSGTPANRRPST